MAGRVIVVRDYEQMSEVAAGLVEKSVKRCIEERKSCTMGLATGNSPVGMYERLCHSANKGKFDSSRLTTFNLDEYIGLAGSNAQDRVMNSESYCYFMIKNFFGKLERPPMRTVVPWANLINYSTLRKELKTHPRDWSRHGTDSGMAVVLKQKPESEYLAWIKRKVLDPYPRMVRRAGGIDIQILGVGGRGHIAFHEAGIPFDLKGLLMVELDPVTVEHAVQDRHFESRKQAPKMALTMSIDMVFKARQVVLLASGERKTAAMEKGLLGPVDPEVPVSYVQKYAAEGGDITIVMDEKAASGLLDRRKELRKKEWRLRVVS